MTAREVLRAAMGRPADGTDAPGAATREVPPRLAAAPGRAPLRWRRTVREAPAAVWWVTALLALLLGVNMLLHPPYRGPDEPLHVDLATALERGEVPLLWEPGTRRPDGGIVAGSLLGNTRITEPQRLADGPETGQDLYVAWRHAHEQATVGRPNQLVQHPPLYYAGLAGVLRLVPDWESRRFGLVVGLLRTVSSVLLLPLPLLAWAAARRMTGDRRVQLASSVLVVVPPQLVHVGASVNNDTLLVLLAAVVVVQAVHVATGDASWRTTVGLGGVVALALLTKGTALPLLPIAMGAYVLALRYQGFRLVLGRAVVAAALSGLGLWWWVRNVVVYGTVQPNGVVVGGIDPIPVVRGWSDGGGEWFRAFVTQVNVSAFFPGPETSTASAVAAVAGASAAVLLVVGLVRPRGRLEVATALDRAFLVAVFAAALAVPLYGSYAAFTLGHDAAGMQGRYLYTAAVAVAFLVARAAPRVPPVAWLVPLVLGQLLAASAAVYFYWYSPSAGAVGTLSAVLDRGPYPNAVDVLLLAAVLPVAVLTARSLLGRSAEVGLPPGPRDEERPEPPVPPAEPLSGLAQGRPRAR